MLLNRSLAFRGMVPPGGMVPYEGLVATLAANYPDWDLCTGAGDTIDLDGLFPVGEDGGATYNLNDTGGSRAGTFLSCSEDGEHSGPGLGGTQVGDGPIHVWSSALDITGADGGLHPHTLIISASWTPPYALRAFIRANKWTHLPAGAEPWLNSNTIPSRFVEDSAVRDRLVLGTTGDSRATGGSNTMGIDITGCSEDGEHDHDPGWWTTNNVGNPCYRNISGGLHAHPDFDDSKVCTLPPYVALRVIKAVLDSPMPKAGVLLFNGSAADIRNGWFFADGLNGTRDCQARWVLGAGGVYSLGDTGGDLIKVTGTKNTGNLNVPHNHIGPVFYETGGATRHANTDWIHNHDVDYEVDKTPDYWACTFIEYRG